MLTRIVLATCIVAGSLLAGDTPNTKSIAKDGSGQARTSMDHGLFATDRGSQAQAKETNEAPAFYSQIIWASACYTFAGPVCPLVVALPVGASCTCYYPNGTLAGIAQ